LDVSKVEYASITGTIEAEGDHDWFKISMVAGNAYAENLGNEALA
jgi:hypothetical protein